MIKAVKKSRTALPLDEIEQEILIMRPGYTCDCPRLELQGLTCLHLRRQIDHPNIVRLFEWYEDGNRIYLVLDYLKGGSLKDVVLQLNKKVGGDSLQERLKARVGSKHVQDERGLKEAWIREVIQQSAGGLAYCHNLRLIHKDLKDENIMLLQQPAWLGLLDS